MSAPNKVVSDSGSDERTPAVNNDLDFNGESKSNYGHWTGHVPPNPLLDVQIDKAVAAVCPCVSTAMYIGLDSRQDTFPRYDHDHDGH